MTNFSTRPILGIDFSGAALAGQKIWVAGAHCEGETLVFDQLARAADLPAGAPERDGALKALCAWIQTFEAPVCGFDFPFSLAAPEVDAATWRDWVLGLPARFQEADAFRAAFEGHKRATDRAAKTPFAPLNLRLYRQTFHGIAHVLAPLLRGGALALPFEAPREDATWLIEICPASLLKAERLYFSYKGKSAAQQANRARILQEVTAKFDLQLAPAMQSAAHDDAEGDALDAILAAVCAKRALEQDDWTARGKTEQLEGRVYF